MALPERALEQLAREPMRTPGFSGRLLMFSGTLLFMSILFYAGLEFGYRPYLRTQIAKLDERIANFSKQVAAEDQAKIIAFYSQLANVQSLLGEHVLTSRLLEWLERNTHGNVSFNRLSLNVSSRQLILAGSARSAVDAIEQIKIFQDQPEVDRITFNNLGAEANNRWRFDVTIFLNAASLREPQDSSAEEGGMNPGAGADGQNQTADRETP